MGGKRFWSLQRGEEDEGQRGEAFDPTAEQKDALDRRDDPREETDRRVRTRDTRVTALSLYFDLRRDVAFLAWEGDDRRTSVSCSTEKKAIDVPSPGRMKVLPYSSETPDPPSSTRKATPSCEMSIEPFGQRPVGTATFRCGTHLAIPLQKERSNRLGSLRATDLLVESPGKDDGPSRLEAALEKVLERGHGAGQ